MTHTFELRDGRQVKAYRDKLGCITVTSIMDGEKNVRLKLPHDELETIKSIAHARFAQKIADRHMVKEQVADWNSSKDERLNKY